MTKKKEKVGKKKEELAVGKDLTIENWSVDIDKQIKDSLNLIWRTKACVIDAPSSVRIYKPPMHYDAFLNYLEWKIDRPWYKRLFLP